MSNIRRFYLKNIPVFITCVCYKRYIFLRDAGNKELLLSVLREVKILRPFKLHAYVILDNHFHIMLTPADEINFSDIIQSVKLCFSARFKKRNANKKCIKIWQNRFWDYMIRDDEDFRRHLDYIHYNPVKHNYTANPANYAWSSYLYFLKKSYYPDDGGGILPESIENMNAE